MPKETELKCITCQKCVNQLAPGVLMPINDPGIGERLCSQGGVAHEDSPCERPNEYEYGGIARQLVLTSWQGY